LKSTASFPEMKDDLAQCSHIPVVTTTAMMSLKIWRVELAYLPWTQMIFSIKPSSSTCKSLEVIQKL